MKPGVQTLKVGVIDVTGVTLDTDYAIDVTSHLPVYKDNRTGENTTKTFAFTEDAIKLAIGKDVSAKISERADKSYSTQVYYAMDIGATRMEEEKVVQIPCHE